MNMVEIWFSIVIKQQVRRGVYHNVPELIAAIEDFIDGYNERAAPLVWTKTADQVLARRPNDKTLQTRCTRDVPDTEGLMASGTPLGREP